MFIRNCLQKFNSKLSQLIDVVVVFSERSAFKASLNYMIEINEIKRNLHELKYNKNSFVYVIVISFYIP